ncbi:RHS repeat domain-containing protein [Dysgonomonas sp.]
MVANQGGTAIQKNHYYPFGTAFADKYDNGTNQPYKYNNKELDQMHGLNLYDYSARYYESAIGRFTTIDPMAEKGYSWSPYVYCLNNPTRLVDPDGKFPFPFMLGGSNPVLPMGRNISMLSNTDKIIRMVPKEEHHLLPRTLKGNEVVRTVREGGFKLEGEENRLSVDKFSRATGEGQHAKHPNYTEQISEKLGN